MPEQGTGEADHARPARPALDRIWVEPDGPRILMKFNYRAGDPPRWQPVYFAIQCRPVDLKVFASQAKPAINASGENASAQILRKHLMNARLEAVGRHRSLRDLALCFSVAGDASPRLLLIRYSMPPVLELVVGGRSNLRFGPGGTYTKSKAAVAEGREAAQPADAGCFQLGDFQLGDPLEYFDSLVTGSSVRETENGEETAVAPAGGGPKPSESVVRRGLKRRLKTLERALERFESTEEGDKVLARLRVELDWLKSNGYGLGAGDFGRVITVGPPVDQPTTPDVGGITLDLTETEDLGMAIAARGEQLRKAKRRREIHGSKRQELLDQIAATRRELAGGAVPAGDDEAAEALTGVAVSSGGVAATGSMMGGRGQSRQERGRQLWHRYLLEAGIEILVGRSAKENDLLTKSAQGNDLWFHTARGSGSHVVVPRASLRKAAAEDAVMRSAAILALHHSPSRRDFSGEVYWCEKRHLRKVKNAAPGAWQVLRASSMHVRYDEEDVRRLLEVRQ